MPFYNASPAMKLTYTYMQSLQSLECAAPSEPVLGVYLEKSALVYRILGDSTAVGGSSPISSRGSAGGGEGFSAFCAAVAVAVGGSTFGNISAKRSGRNLSTRFQVSVQISEHFPPADGGTRYPPSAITSRIFLRLSGTASSYAASVKELPIST